MHEEIELDSCTVSMIGGREESSSGDCCVYLVTSTGFGLVVDTGTGTAESIKRIMKNLKKKTDPRNVQHVLVTHCHIDHAGGLKDLSRQLTSAKLVAHEYAAKVIEQEDRVLSAAKWYGLSLKAVKVDISINKEYTLKDSNELTLKIIPTPGHTPGSVVGVLESSGNTVLFGQDIHGPFNSEFGSDIAQWRESMQQLLKLRADYLCEGHYGIIKGKKRVEDFIIRYLEQHAR
ncbi:MAG: MBL fold metallo-hydrolase [Candidatus Hodarchaeales archaeon]|jgi:glyoxylase-like metal-dependent hydrolase (beta-lactamase superfamily II)